MPPPDVHVLDPQHIRRGPDEIRGSIGSHAFIFTKYPDPKGNRWFLQPGAGNLCGREVVMLWGTPPGWEAMVGEVLKHLGIGPQNDAVVVVRNSAQYMARDFCDLDGDDGA